MKETMLLIGHGARDKEGDGNREVEEFAQQWRQKVRWTQYRPPQIRAQ